MVGPSSCSRAGEVLAHCGAQPVGVSVRRLIDLIGVGRKTERATPTGGIAPQPPTVSTVLPSTSVAFHYTEREGPLEVAVSGAFGDLYYPSHKNP